MTTRALRVSVCTIWSIFIATCSFGVRHCHGYCCFCAVIKGLSRVFLRQQEAERHDMRGLIETLPRGNDRLCFITGWTRNVLLLIVSSQDAPGMSSHCFILGAPGMSSSHCFILGEPGMSSSHCFILGGPGMSYFPLLYIQGGPGMSYFPLLYIQGGPGMSYFPLLYTGWTWNVLLPIAVYRVDQECLTSCMALKMSKPA